MEKPASARKEWIVFPQENGYDGRRPDHQPLPALGGRETEKGRLNGFA